LKLIVGVSGASGAVYGVRLLEELEQRKIETHLIVSPAAEQTIKIEVGMTINHLKDLATVRYDINDLQAPIASGDFKADGMVIIPCSMKTLAGIANGYSDNLLLRAADVTLKEGRKLVLVPRETPLSPIHLENMLKLSKIGVIVLVAAPAFYHKPRDVNDLVGYIVGKVLDSFNIAHKLYDKWRA